MEVLNPSHYCARAAESSLKETQRAVDKRFSRIRQIRKSIDDEEARFASCLAESKMMLTALIQQVAQKP